MGQTLTHGVYLPDEGERNCYSGLAANWQLLDGAVGTIAEHTTQIAGKAPAVHTHTKSDITDFPAYGNTAGTICEGNDSRLSDARTPVAHTHTKSDVTDLFNSANTWSKAQTYSDGNAIVIKNSGVEIGNEPSAYNEQRVVFNDKNGYGIAAIKYQNQLSASNVFINGLEFSASDKFKDGVRDPTGTTTTTVLRIGLWNDGTKYIYNEGRWRSNLLPFGNNTNDVGSSSYQWNNLYAKNYYYNGTAWGLDKANVWTQSQTFNADTIYRSTVKRGTAPGSVVYMEFADYKDSSNNRFSLIGASYTTAKASDCCIYAYKTTVATGNAIGKIGIGCDSSGNVYTIAPTPESSDNSTQIATTAYVKSQGYLALNGLNPGVLSLPNYDASIAQDISGDMVPDQYGRNIRFTPTMNGWMYVDFNISNATFLSGAQEMLVQVKDSNIANANFVVNFVTSIGSSHIFVYLPVLKGRSVILEINFTGFSIGKGYVYQCQGNV